MKKTITCIGCPMGCQVTATIENGDVTEVTGHTCVRGDRYARKEVISPTRIVTTTVMVSGGELAMASVKTATDIPKTKIKECVETLKGVMVCAPVTTGQIIVDNVCGTGVPIVATRDVNAL